MWQATNPVNRDFRLETFGANWTSPPLSDQGGGHYVAHVTAPATGATAFFIEMKYNVDGVQLTFTTQISTVPLPEVSLNDGALAVSINSSGNVAVNLSDAGAVDVNVNGLDYGFDAGSVQSITVSGASGPAP